MTKSLMFVLSVSAMSLCAAGALRANDAAVASSSTAGASAAMAASSTAAAPAAVAANDAPGSLKAGKALLDAGKYADAVANFNGIGEQVADHGKTKREPYRQLDLATAYLGLGQYAQAEQAASAALAVIPDMEGAWNDLASAQVNGGDRDKAIATYKQGVDQLTKDGVDHSRLDTNLLALQAAAGDTADSDQSSASASTPTAKAPTAKASAAAPAAKSPKANSAATVGN